MARRNTQPTVVLELKKYYWTSAAGNSGSENHKTPIKVPRGEGKVALHLGRSKGANRIALVFSDGRVSQFALSKGGARRVLSDPMLDFLINQGGRK